MDNKYQGTLDTPDAINSQYIISKELGRGAYGTVYLAEDRNTGEQVAVKRIDDVFRTKTDAKRTLREISILRQCHHPNISQLKNVLLPPDEDSFRQLWVVQEYGGWDLSKVLKSYRKITGWCDKHVKSIIYQIANLIHRDLKPSNILVDGKCIVKIIDFGLARQMFPTSRKAVFSTGDATDSTVWDNGQCVTERQMTQHVVTRWYRAPELILMQTDYCSSIDIWSVGCIMAELLQTLESSVTRIKPLFPGTTCFPLSAPKKDKNKKGMFEQEFRAETHQLEKIFEIIGIPSVEDIEVMEDGPMKTFLLNLEPTDPHNLLDMIPCASPDAITLLHQMLQFNPHKRITIEEALKSPFFDDVRNEEYEIGAQEQMVFPFERDEISSESNEKKRLRQLIYKEALIFSNFHHSKSFKTRNSLPTPTASIQKVNGTYIVPKASMSTNSKESSHAKQCSVI